MEVVNLEALRALAEVPPEALRALAEVAVEVLRALIHVPVEGLKNLGQVAGQTSAAGSEIGWSGPDNDDPLKLAIENLNEAMKRTNANVVGAFGQYFSEQRGRIGW